MDLPLQILQPSIICSHHAAFSLFSLKQPPVEHPSDAVKGFVRWESSDNKARRERARLRQLPTERKTLPSVKDQNAVQPAETAASDVQVIS